MPRGTPAYSDRLDCSPTANATSIGGDTDTVACIAGGLAEALHGLPEEIAAQARAYLTDDLKTVVARFHETYGA